jgi:hypothetical protein
MKQMEPFQFDKDFASHVTAGPVHGGHTERSQEKQNEQENCARGDERKRAAVATEIHKLTTFS